MLTLRRPAGMRAWALPDGSVARALLRWTGEAVWPASSPTSPRLVTLIAAGELPDWGLYLDTLRAFLVGGGRRPHLRLLAVVAGLGARRRLLSPRPPGSACARDPQPGARQVERPLTVALGGIDRLRDRAVQLPGQPLGRPHHSLRLPAGRDGGRPVARAAPQSWARRSVAASARALIAAAAAAVLLISVAWSSAGTRFSQSALAVAARAASPWTTPCRRLWHIPPLEPAATEGEQLLDRYMPGEDETPVLTSPTSGSRS